MKLLLDENLPIKLKYRFSEAGYNVFTVKDMQWLGKENGTLLSLMLTENFTVFVTVDSNLSFQQNFKNYPIGVLVLIAPSNTYETIMEYFEKIIEELQSMNGNITSVVHPAINKKG